jgi:hypothetical protein
VRDEHHASAFGGQPPYGREEPFALGLVQRRRRLVEQQDLVGVLPPVESAGDGDDRPLGGSQFLDRRGDVEGGAEPGDEPLRALPLGPAADARFSTVVSIGMRPRSWWITWIAPVAACSEVSVPSPQRTVISAPASGSWTPVRTLTSVDFPEPFWPTTATTSPARTSRSTSALARWPGQVLLTFRTVSSGPATDGAVTARSTAW